MLTKILFAVFTSNAYAQNKEVLTYDVEPVLSEIREVNEKTHDALVEMRVLELLLMDKKNYREYCTDISWEQPTAKEYREKMNSLLPEKCKERIPEEDLSPPGPE